jgi:uncharacterized Zn finger protein
MIDFEIPSGSEGDPLNGVYKLMRTEMSLLEKNKEDKAMRKEKVGEYQKRELSQILEGFNKKIEDLEKRLNEKSEKRTIDEKRVKEEFVELMKLLDCTTIVMKEGNVSQKRLKDKIDQFWLMKMNEHQAQRLAFQKETEREIEEKRKMLEEHEDYLERIRKLVGIKFSKISSDTLRLSFLEFDNCWIELTIFEQDYMLKRTNPSFRSLGHPYDKLDSELFQDLKALAKICRKAFSKLNQS